MDKSQTRLIRALLRQPVDRTPVWMMRQAGRYLPEYRQLRSQSSDFMSFCKTPELAVEATLQPLARFELDAAIVFSDILTIPDAMGMDLEFIPNKGPVFAQPIRTQADVDALKQPDINQELGYVMQAVTLSSAALPSDIPLIGFSGSPWTVATYMVEGQSSKVWPTVKKMINQQPDIMHSLLDHLTDVTITYLNGQVASGANALMVFDTWGGILSNTEYQQFSLRYLDKIASSVNRERDGVVIPLTFFTKPAAAFLPLIAASGCDAVSLDSSMNIQQARNIVDGKVALQGNLDPFILYSDVDNIKQQVKLILEQYGPHPGHVFNLGHGIDKDTPIASVAAMIEAVHQYSPNIKNEVQL